jgi:hypothetical protein
MKGPASKSTHYTHELNSRQNECEWGNMLYLVSPTSLTSQLLHSVRHRGNLLFVFIILSVAPFGSSLQRLVQSVSHPHTQPLPTHILLLHSSPSPVSTYTRIHTAPVNSEPCKNLDFCGTSRRYHCHSRSVHRSHRSCGQGYAGNVERTTQDIVEGLRCNTTLRSLAPQLVAPPTHTYTRTHIYGATIILAAYTADCYTHPTHHTPHTHPTSRTSLLNHLDTASASRTPNTSTHELCHRTDDFAQPALTQLNTLTMNSATALVTSHNRPSPSSTWIGWLALKSVTAP